MTDLLSRIEIATPCPASWADMTGDDKCRFCALCEKNIYNLAEMTDAEAHELLTGDGKVCARIYRRADGTVMTADCPVGRQRRRRRRGLAIAGSFVLSALGLVVGAGTIADSRESVATFDRSDRRRGVLERVVHQLVRWFDGRSVPTVETPPVIMGVVYIPDPEVPSGCDQEPLTPR